MQTSVSTDFDRAVAGLLADLGTAESGDILSYTSEEATAGIPFGICVAQGTADDGAKLVATTADVLIGIAVYGNHFATTVDGSPELIPADGITYADPAIMPEVTFGVMRRGRIWVRTEEAVAPGDPVRVRGVVTSNDTGYLAANAEQKGAFRKTADDTTDTTDISAFARWCSTAGAGELALLEADFTNAALSNPD